MFNRLLSCLTEALADCLAPTVSVLLKSDKRAQAESYRYFLVSSLKCIGMNMQRVGSSGRGPQASTRATVPLNSNKNLLQVSFKGDFRIIPQSETHVMETFCNTLYCRSGQICLGSQRNNQTERVALTEFTVVLIYSPTSV